MQLVLAYPMPWKPSWWLWVGHVPLENARVFGHIRPGPQIFFSLPPLKLTWISPKTKKRLMNQTTTFRAGREMKGPSQAMISQNVSNHPEPSYFHPTERPLRWPPPARLKQFDRLPTFEDPILISSTRNDEHRPQKTLDGAHAPLIPGRYFRARHLSARSLSLS